MFLIMINVMWTNSLELSVGGFCFDRHLWNMNIGLLSIFEQVDDISEIKVEASGGAYLD